MSVEKVSVEFTDVDFVIPVSTKSTSRFLSRPVTTDLHAVKSMSAHIRPGRLTAILGPSGSGKTTLLNLLSGRASQASIPGSKFTGTISLNGSTIDPVQQRSQFAYVLSEDAIHGLLTPEECLRFAVQLRHPELSREEQEARIESVIQELGMDKCRHTFVGNELVKGISSGERKRTSVGIELINDPLVMFCDEPTTGLDSYSAYQLVSLLKTLAEHGRCVVSTIHQPASETFALFDDVLFLAKGYLIYHGPVSGVRTYFASHGHVCPENYNPSDFVMMIIQTLSEEKLAELAEKWKVDGMATEKAAVVKIRSDAGELSVKLPKIIRAPFKQQLSLLVEREKKTTFRDKRLIGMKFISPIFLILLISGILYGEGSGSSDSQSHVAAVTVIAINSLMSCLQPSLLTFPLERPVFLREYSGGLYSLNPYFISKIILELPMAALQVANVVLIGFFMMKLQGNFGIIYSGAYLLAIAGGSLGMSIGAFASTVREAVELSPLLIMPQFLFAGLWVRISLIPAVLRWIQYIVPMKYAVSILYVGEFRNLSDGETIMEANDVQESHLWVYYVVLVAIIIFIRLFGLYGLTRAAKSTVY